MNFDITLNRPEPKWEFPEISPEPILVLARANRLGELVELVQKIMRWEEQEQFERAYYQKLRAKFSPS